MNLWLSDPKSKEPSVTLTLLVSGFVVCIIKLIIAGIEFKAFKAAQFSGTDFAAAVGALGALYWARRTGSNSDESSKNS